MLLQSALSVLISVYVSSGPVNFLLHVLSASTKQLIWSLDLHALKQKQDVLWKPCRGRFIKTVAGDYSVVTNKTSM